MELMDLPEDEVYKGNRIETTNNIIETKARSCDNTFNIPLISMFLHLLNNFILYLGF